ncbi:hypothetical protein BSKO_01936 [Bryopsis sp. KO-2023]|nr:hypothetical protein BSKO_01936 [Bryopsis sp. KO-2023]
MLSAANGIQCAIGRTVLAPVRPLSGGAIRHETSPASGGRRKIVPRAVPVHKPTNICLSDDEVCSIEDKFSAADLDGNGRIDIDELRGLLESTDCGKVYLIEHWMPEQEVKRIMKQYDRSRTGSLSYKEFLSMVQDGVLLEGKLDEYRAAFDAADTSGYGSISFNELSTLFKSLDQDITDEDLLEVMHRYDLDESGQIEFNEFLLFFRNRLLELRDVMDYLHLKHPDLGESEKKTQNLVDVKEGEVTTVYLDTELDEVLADASDKLVVLFVGLTWCRASKALSGVYKALAKGYPSAVFLKLYGNSNANTKNLFKTRLLTTATPAIFLFREGEVIASFSGVNNVKLEKSIRANLGGDLPAALYVEQGEEGDDVVGKGDVGRVWGSRMR